MNIVKYLQAQGIGSRQFCRLLLSQNRVAINGCTPPDDIADTNTSLHLTIDGKVLSVLPLPKFYILLNKPANYETSHKPTHYPSVFSLLPTHWQNLNIQAVGRLDADTTGVLLLTNDGQFNHFLTSPKNHITKLYHATLKHSANDDLCQQLMNGVLLHDENETVRALSATLLTPTLLALEIDSGKYHQVKRMIAACGNRVAQLHRQSFAKLTATDVAQGQWRLVSQTEIV